MIILNSDRRYFNSNINKLTPLYLERVFSYLDTEMLVKTGLL